MKLIGISRWMGRGLGKIPSIGDWSYIFRLRAQLFYNVANNCFVLCRGRDFMYQVISDTTASFPKWLRLTIGYLSSASFITMLFCILG